ncbi:hypothetical protein DFH09DRAFT_1353948 [Mycena vulgaris]|nr:hypothetical protein DFH09DRAFT_1353948 [Mycena vulgaris]
MSAIGPALPPRLPARPDATDADDERQLPPPAAVRPLLFLSALDPSTYSMHLGTQLDVDPTKLNARTLARSTDNALWTETPAERQQCLADEVSGTKYRGRGLRKEALRGFEKHTRKTRG